MDKKDVKDFIVKISKIYFEIFIKIIIPISILFSIIGGIINGNIIEIIKTNIISTIGGFVLVAIIIYGGIGLVYLFLIIKRKHSIISSYEYIRELPKYFPPAIASLLLDLNIEITTDYTATIAYLISKKYIKLSENKKEVEVISKNPDFKSRHEIYVFRCITNEEKFNSDEFKKLIIYDAKNMGLIEETKRKIHFFRNISIDLLVAFISSMILEHLDITFLRYIFSLINFTAVVAFPAIIAYSIYLLPKYDGEKDFCRTKKGNEEAKKWSGLKSYLSNYTLISEKNLEDIIIFDDYIPYAIALNEAKSIEKFIENNENYRVLIYGKNINNIE